MSSPDNAKPSLAILNDYASLAPSKLSHLQSRLNVVQVPGTFDVRSPSARAELVNLLQPYAIISTMRERTAFPAEVIRALPNLKVLLTTGAKNAAIDLQACQERGIVVAGTNGRSNPLASSLAKFQPTNEHTWALILGLAKRVAEGDASIHAGGWETGLGAALAGKKLGLLGLGKLGAQAARTGMLGFNMEILAWSENLTQEKADEAARNLGVEAGKWKVAGSKEALFREADILSVHYVLSERSRGIVGHKELSVMKNSALLINTSRGPLVDEKALLDCLKDSKFRGVALDVFDTEPLERNSEWRTTQWGKDGRSQVLLSPHMGYVEEGNMNAWYNETVENVERWLDGKELHTIISMP
ncbi:MAG: hypothetical protein Q9227_003983 [Pyrenula ochraceoflavens]